ncbi:hypothetical protein ONZ45_g18951 [Pleurotus djamor]|nr:hypothetical protein ONZ45_g18951 [Pleurotus djamor]
MSRVIQWELHGQGNIYIVKLVPVKRNNRQRIDTPNYATTMGKPASKTEFDVNQDELKNQPAHSSPRKVLELAGSTTTAPVTGGGL